MESLGTGAKGGLEEALDGETGEYFAEREGECFAEREGECFAS